MTLRHLTIFVTVTDTGGMSKAARVLHTSQPSISQAILELERYYGVKLFERLSQKLYLTKDGELLLSYARHILDSYKQMEDAMNQARERTQIQIGCSVSIGTCLINDILDKAEKELPNCSFHVMVANSSEIEYALLNNQVDIGIIEGMINSENLSTTPICKDELVFVCGRHHPLASAPSITLDMLNGHNYVSRESGSSEKNQYEQLLDQQNIHLNRTFCSTNTEAIKNSVICGRGIAIFSKRMVKNEVANGDLVILNIKDTSVIRNFNFVVHANKYMSNPLKIMQEICVDID